MIQYIHGVHDHEGASLMGNRPGWITFTEAIGSDPYDESGGDYRQWASQGFKVIVRLNNGYRSDTSRPGTIPLPEKYGDFALRCANFIDASPGIFAAIIGNEPNHDNERPEGQLILPTQYAKCFNLCYEEIKYLNTEVKITPAAVAPWDATTKYSGNGHGDWVIYHRDMYNSIFKADAICIHTYTHGPNPGLIADETRMNPPFTTKYYNFRAYRDFMHGTPTKFRDLPVYITETDQVQPWLDKNTGWVVAAYDEIDDWNHGAGSRDRQKIHCLCLYCSHKRDQWWFMDKPGVIGDFQNAVLRGFSIDVDDSVTPDPEPPRPPQPEPAPPPIKWDDRLNKRGIELTESIANPGDWEWAVVEGKWYNEEQAQGRVNAFFTLEDEKGNLAAQVPVVWYWSSGKDDSKKTEIKGDPWLGHLYSIDFGMSSVAPSYGFYVNDGTPSEKIWGMGLGDLTRPDWNIHTAYEFRFRKRRKVGVIVPPDPTPPDPTPIPPNPLATLIHPVLGAVITQHFYQNPKNYEQFGMPGHNGTDFGGKPVGHPIVAIADGVVVYSEWDAGYGWYVRMEHRDGNKSYSSMYCHLSEKGATAGTQVKAGQTIGKLGSTGNSTGPHLHLEIRLINSDGQYKMGTPMPKGRVDPETFCIERGLNL